MWVLLANCDWPMHVHSPTSVQQLLRDGGRIIANADVPAALAAAEAKQPGPDGPELLTSADLARVDARAANAQQMARNVRSDLTADLTTVEGRVAAIQQAQTELDQLAARLGAAIPAADAVHEQLHQADVDLSRRIDTIQLTPGPPGKDSTVPGPPGKDSTVPGPPGKDSTVPGPPGKDSTVPGPPGTPGTIVYRAKGTRTLSSLLGIGAQATVNCPFSNGTPPTGYDPQITVLGGPAAVVSFTRVTASNSLDVVVQATAALALGTVITCNVQATG